MQKTEQFERRRPSLLKPIFYLVLQTIAVIEVFALLNATFDIRQWSLTEIALCLAITVYFALQSSKIIKRTKQAASKWEEKAQMQSCPDANPS